MAKRILRFYDGTWNSPEMKKVSVPILPVCVVLLSIIGLSFTTTGALAQEVTRDAVTLNTCQEFNQYLDTTGVTLAYEDENGPQTKSFKKTAGKTATAITPAVTRSKVTTRKQSKTLLRCSCTGDLFENIETCQANCRVTLGCFTGICAPALSSDQWCAEMTVRIKYTPDIRSAVIYWMPPQSTNISASCKAERDTWFKNNVDHEKAHIAISKDQIKKANDEFNKPKHLQACRKTKVEAIAAVNKSADEYEAAALDAVTRRVSDAHKLFHASHGATTPRLNCSKCN